MLASLDLVVSGRVEAGRVRRHCVHCVPYTGVTPKLYESTEALWIDHLFEDLP